MSLRVSVIVPTFNRSLLLRDAVASLLAQSVAPFEIFIVDDGSTDDTAQVANSFSPHVTYLLKTNGGKASALNYGWERCTGDAVLILDDDDIAAPDALALLGASLEARPDCGFAYGMHDYFSATVEGGRRIWPVGDLPFVQEDQLIHALMDRCFIFQPGTLFRRECIDIAGGFDTKMVRSQDYDFLLRVAMKSRGVRVDAVVFYQRQHDGMRGTAAQSITLQQRDEAWAVYDRKIFKQLRADNALAAFDRGGEAAASGDARLRALIRRGCVMGRKGLWGEAAADMTEAVSLGESSGGFAARSLDMSEFEALLGPYSVGLDLFPAAAAYRRAIDRIVDRRTREGVKAAICKPLPYQFRRAFQRREWARMWVVLRCLGAVGSLPVFSRAALSRLGSVTPSALARTSG